MYKLKNGENMSTVEQIEGGKWKMIVYTVDGIVNHIFDNLEQLEKYAKKCYTPPRSNDLVSSNG